MPDFLITFFTPENAVALLTLTALEIVLGIDNIIFLSILTAKLREQDRPRARFIGLALAMGARIALLLGITWVIGLVKPLFTIMEHGFSGKDLILLGGGLFLIAKSTHEIHAKMEDDAHSEGAGAAKAANFASVIVQIVIIDLVFSLDSVITAVGMVNSGENVKHVAGAATAMAWDKLAVMVTAVVISIIVMMLFAGRIGAFVERHPTIKILALSFLILIGVMLVVEGWGGHVSKNYIYFAMAFALGVELLNMRLRKKAVAHVGSGSGHPPTSGAPH